MTVDSMIRAAEAWLGTGEPNQIQSWYRDRNGADYSGNFAWCDAAVTRWSVDAGEWDAVCLGKDRPYTPEHAQAFLTAGRWTYGSAGAQRGDIVFFDWSMSAPGVGRIGNIDHVGVVTDSLSNGQVATIEGNTLDVCARRIRGPEVIVGYGRPAYTQAPPPPAPTPRAIALPPLRRSINRLLQNYCEGDDARAWQEYMHNVRCWTGLSIDGEYGPQSASICRAFQQDSTAHGWPLQADGIVGPKTIDVMLHRPVTLN